MASNFRILSHQKRNNLHLKLTGDFDGSSAYELIRFLEEKSSCVFRIFIHTRNLKTVYPFGREVFQNNLSAISRHSHKLVFVGDNNRFDDEV
jgi:hypothetical protein